MKSSVMAIAVVAFATNWIWSIDVFAATPCDIEKRQAKDEYSRSIADVCNASLMDFKGTFAFVESGLWPVPNYFVLRVDSSPDLNFSSMDILTGSDPLGILRGALRISTRMETKYDGEMTLVESDSVDVLTKDCRVDASLFEYEVELPLADQRMNIFELHINRTIIAIRDFDHRMINAMVLAYVRLNCH
ncbi:MAG: hypothetical protein ACXIUM_13095 [Wenzhouxiangella sp.]